MGRSESSGPAAASQTFPEAAACRAETLAIRDPMVKERACEVVLVVPMPGSGSDSISVLSDHSEGRLGNGADAAAELSRRERAPA